MNRKQRRASSKSQPAKPPAELYARAVQAHREGRLEEAEQLYREVLAANSRHADSLHRLGVVAYQKGRPDLAETLLRKAIAQDAQVAAYHSHLSLALDALGRLDEAVDCCRLALEREPGLADVHNNLGALLMRLGQAGEAAVSYQRAIALEQGWPEVHNNLGNALLALDRAQDAAASYRSALALAPDFADAHANLAAVLQAGGQSAEAIAHFRRALEIAPNQPEIFAALALAHLAQGDHTAAMQAIIRSLALQETPAARRAFVQCVKDVQFEQEAGPLSALLLRALREGWDRPDDLAPVCAAAIKHSPAMAPLLEAADRGVFDDNGLAVLAQDRLLQALLCITPNRDIELERLLTLARRHLLRAALSAPQDDAALEFPAALARQCFINEYVFSQGDEEAAQARQLRDGLVAALEKDQPVPACWVAMVAAYFPLASVCMRLTQRTWPEPVAALLVQQIQEPQEEKDLQKSVARLTAISDPVSRLVQAQYEENPYPRWVVAGSSPPPEDLVSHLRRTFPHAVIADGGSRQNIDILVAGCGTGRNAIETAQRFQHARLLAVDLSLSSLGHAARKSRGQAQIEYAQGDLLELASALETTGRRFDLIEAVGVLHHLADPYAGWRVLLSLLKPGGFMLVGVYSALARRNLPPLRGRLAAKGYGPAAGDVRRARQDLMQSRDLAYAATYPDFFSISTCRDLLFHVQEQALALEDIDAFLRENALNFLGFSIEDAVLADYRRRYPQDRAAADLRHWQDFERDNPDCFSGMYQFWLQKAL